MIGGIEVRFAPVAADGLQRAVAALCSSWPDAVVENPETGQRYDSCQAAPLAQLEEVFVYRDAASADVWDAEGAVSAVQNAMMHILKDEETITVVFDRHDSKTDALIAAIEAVVVRPTARSA